MRRIELLFPALLLALTACAGRPPASSQAAAQPSRTDSAAACCGGMAQSRGMQHEHGRPMAAGHDSASMHQQMQMMMRGDTAGMRRMMLMHRDSAGMRHDSAAMRQHMQTMMRGDTAAMRRMMLMHRDSAGMRRDSGMACCGGMMMGQGAQHQHGAMAAAAPMAAAAVAGAGAHQETMVHNRHYLISAESLAARSGRPGIVIIHVGRTDSLYLAGHLPGARFLPYNAVARTVNGVANEFPHPDTMANALSSLVIRPEDRIVLYGDDILMAARAWVALDLMGQAERTALLDGGMAAWRASGGAVQPGPVPVQRIHIPFTYTWQPQKLVTADWVRTHLRDSTVMLLDARPADQFGGAEPPCAPNVTPCVQIPEARRGHLPGAVNLFWMNLVQSREQPRTKPMHDIHEGMLVPMGTDQPYRRTLVTYCRSGVQASYLYFVLRWINYPDVRLYDGSFGEWAGRDAATHPVMRPSAGGMMHQHH